MLPFVAAVTFAMKALCLAANSGLLSLEDRLAFPSLASDLGDSEPSVGGGGPGTTGLTPGDKPIIKEKIKQRVKHRKENSRILFLTHFRSPDI